MKNIFKFSLFLSACAIFVSCETTELELLENPNAVNVESADPNFVLNQIQLDFNSIVGSYSGNDQGLVRLAYQFGTYSNAIDDLTGGTSWDGSYGMFANIDFLESVIETNELDLPYHIGITKVLEAYGYMLLVDHFGDVPFTQAVQPEEFPNPVADSGAAVYAAQIEVLNDAIALLSQTSAVLPEDFYYETFDPNNWIALANSLKIRAYVNQRLVDPGTATAGINSVLNSNIINTVAEDFQFRYNTSQPHPAFSAEYSNTVDGFRSNNLYDYLNAGDADQPFVETGTPDPRLRYYIYRQSPDAPSGSNLPCLGDGSYDYCYVGNLYWGRDHGDTEGLPNDGAKKTGRGVYPSGGAFDNNAFVRSRDAINTLSGAGVAPIYLSSFTQFALAEAALTLGTGGGSAVSRLESGIRLSMEKVIAFGATLDTNDPDTGDNLAATSADVNAYVAGVLAEYSAASNSGKLAIIAREQWLASYQYGVEPYNTYRRTGFPELQEPIQASGLFPRTWRYPSNEVSNNPNISQTNPSNRTFWDNNPANFID